MPSKATEKKTTCFHCGLKCPDKSISIGDKYFCCTGCRTVYKLLSESNLDAYYPEGETPGIRPETDQEIKKFAYLDDAVIKRHLIQFTDGHTSRVTLSIPQMHCASCIWLLENLYRLRPGISQSRVNFLRRELSVVFDDTEITLRGLVELLARIGYEPSINLDSLDSRPTVSENKALYIKLGVAGFSFGNIMLFSFPDYLTTGGLDDKTVALVFGYLSIMLSLPVLLYSARDYFTSAISGLRSRMVNIDVPIALGMSVLFLRSVYEIIAGIGQGYLDSFVGLVFFLLLGRIFQQKTYDRMSFDRDYKSYFPISVIRLTGGEHETVPVTSLKVGDRIIVRNQELVPADAHVLNGDARIDYSFVTGESSPRKARTGEVVYAGGRQAGGAVELEVARDVSQSYLTSLWNNTAFTSDSQSKITSVTNSVAKYFTAAVLTIAAGGAIYWLPGNPATAVNAVTSVLIVACPCALALSSPFALGAAIRIFGRNKLYLKNTSVIEAMARIDAIVFDKTGTLTEPQKALVSFEGQPLSDHEKQLVASLVRHSTHPVSRQIADLYESVEGFEVSSFAEKPGLGISGTCDSQQIVLGREDWVSGSAAKRNESGIRPQYETTVSVSINGRLRGRFHITNAYREGLQPEIAKLGSTHELSVISGDNDSEREALRVIFGGDTSLQFGQSPHDKLEFVRELQAKGRKVMMVGDGLNDAGALRMADFGLAVSEDTAAFSPACDGILDAESFSLMTRFLNFARRSVMIIMISIGISFIYNLVGLSFAVSGTLSPVVAAILMPLSSISVVVFATLAANFEARRVGLR